VFESSSICRRLARVEEDASIESLPFWWSLLVIYRTMLLGLVPAISTDGRSSSDARKGFRFRSVARFSLSLSFQLKLTHLPLFLSPNFMYKKNARRETQNDSVSNENAVPLPRTRAHARRRDGFTVQTKVSIFIGVNLRGNV